MGEGDDRLLMVPVRPGRCGSVAVRTGRLDTGERVGLAFTSLPALAEVFGSEQEWIPLNGAVAREMFGLAGAAQMRIDAVPVPVPVPVSVSVSVSVPVPALAAAGNPDPVPALAPAPAPVLALAPVESVGRPAPKPRRPRVRLAYLSLAMRHAH
ncbi:hypothetical protein GCM10009839_52410 [Catenulispora yoronensis]|uniref:SseB protein N-terminal domain-containing protein n=1 Tax=Catenulispora yoronensis TaxID=450799 RepID=A0ABP5GD00_9ACTN